MAQEAGTEEGYMGERGDSNARCMQRKSIGNRGKDTEHHSVIAIVQMDARVREQSMV